MHVKEKKWIKILVVKLEGKRSLRRHMRERIIIKWIIKQTRWECVKWISLGQEGGGKWREF
jgi:hypothetical protein